MNYIINATRTLKDSKLGVQMGVEMFKSSLQDNLRLRKWLLYANCEVHQNLIINNIN